MANLKSGKKSKRKNKGKTLSFERRFNKAKTYLVAEQYGKALSELKAIWKTEKSELVKASLLDAYVKRAKQLAGKGLYKEAHMLLENSHSLCGTVSTLDLYISWLSRAEPLSKVMKAYKKHRAEIASNPCYYPITEVIATLLLYDQVDVEMMPHEDGPLIKHRDIIRNILACYTNGQDEEALSHLKQIPYRSPYRNLSFILKALIIIAQDKGQGQATALLQQVPSNSPFFQMAQSIQAVIEPSLSAALMGKINLAVVLEAKGLDEKSVVAFKEIASVPNHNFNALFNCLVKHRETATKMIVKAYCYQMLPEVVRQIVNFEKTFGPISPDEKKHIKALAADKNHDTDLAIIAWRDYLASLKKQATSPILKLKQAFVLRHIAHHIEGSMDPNCDCEDCMDTREDYCDLLEETLALDPHDKNTYFSLMKLHDKNAKKPNQRYCRLVNQLSDTFPRDPEVLCVAINTAYRQKTFSKAMKLAKKWLTLDPVNQTAKKLLLDVQLSYIKNQLQKGKSCATDKINDVFAEIESKNNQGSNKINAQLIEINKVLLNLVQRKNQKESIKWLEDSFAKSEDKLVFCCQVLLEAEQYGIKPDTLTFLPKKAVQARKQQDIILAFKQLEKYKPCIDIKGAAIEKIQKLLAPPKTLELSKDVWIWINELLIELKLYQFAEVYAKQANKQFSNEPLLVYYLIVAKSKNDPERIEMVDMDNLQGAMTLAQEERNIKDVQLIGALIEKVMEATGGFTGMLLDFIQSLDDPPRSRKSRALPF